MKIKILTKPYEVSDVNKIKTEEIFYMAKVNVTKDNNEIYETILAYHVNNDKYFLLKTESKDLINSFGYTNNISKEKIELFMKIEKMKNIKEIKSIKDWIYISP